MPSIGTCFRFYTQMRVEKTNKAFAYKIYSHFTQQCTLAVLGGVKRDRNSVSHFVHFFLHNDVFKIIIFKNKFSLPIESCVLNNQKDWSSLASIEE